MSEQEKEWEEEAIKEANLHFLKDMPLVAFIKGYLQACKVRQGECPFCHETGFDLVGLKIYTKRMV